MIILRVTRRCGFTRHTRVNLKRVYLMFLEAQHSNGVPVARLYFRRFFTRRVKPFSTAHNKYRVGRVRLTDIDLTEIFISLLR